jgi:1-acyl-sn-glycerol-3-phosphate acyltransferase
MPLFGVVVRIRKEKEEKIERCVIVGNHRSSFDVFPFLAETNVKVLIGTNYEEEILLEIS